MLNSKLLRKETVAEGTMAFYFEKSADFVFKAGNSLDLYLIDPPETDAEGDKRAFSIAAAPFEPDLMITTRMRDTAFKRTLKNMAPGTEVEIDGPFGSMIIPEPSDRPLVFLAGGIGVTLFFSMVKQAARDRLPHKLYMFYSNRRPEDAPFLDELETLRTENPNFHFIPTMTEKEKSSIPWSGRTGYIDKNMLSEVLGDLPAPVYYIAGPPGMVTAMYQMLVSAGIPADDINTEQYSGY